MSAIVYAMAHVAHEDAEMRKNQKDALALIRKLKSAGELDLRIRFIPMSAVYALLQKGEIMFDGEYYRINDKD